MEKKEYSSIIKTTILEKRIRELEGIETRYEDLLNLLYIDKKWNDKAIKEEVSLFENLSQIFNEMFCFKKKKNGIIKYKVSKVKLNKTQVENLYRLLNEENIRIFKNG